MANLWNLIVEIDINFIMGIKFSDFKFAKRHRTKASVVERTQL